VVFVSAVTLWEIAFKRSIGKHTIPVGYLDAISACQFTEMPITREHARETEGLPFIHRDPFDRMLVAFRMADPDVCCG
jgi:PIN domain nuclease of toxin-antitoxin system